MKFSVWVATMMFVVYATFILWDYRYYEADLELDEIIKYDRASYLKVPKNDYSDYDIERSEPIKKEKFSKGGIKNQ